MKTLFIDGRPAKKGQRVLSSNSSVEVELVGWIANAEVITIKSFGKLRVGKVSLLKNANWREDRGTWSDRMRTQQEGRTIEEVRSDTHLTDGAREAIKGLETRIEAEKRARLFGECIDPKMPFLCFGKKDGVWFFAGIKGQVTYTPNEKESPSVSFVFWQLYNEYKKKFGESVFVVPGQLRRPMSCPKCNPDGYTPKILFGTMYRCMSCGHETPAFDKSIFTDEEVDDGK